MTNNKTLALIAVNVALVVITIIGIITFVSAQSSSKALCAPVLSSEVLLATDNCKGK